MINLISDDVCDCSNSFLCESSPIIFKARQTLVIGSQTQVCILLKYSIDAHNWGVICSSAYVLKTNVRHTRLAESSFHDIIAHWTVFDLKSYVGASNEMPGEYVSGFDDPTYKIEFNI